MSGAGKRIAVITGPTATGKSRLSLDAAHALIGRGTPACIVSMDSMQVYRYMDIGTDKLLPEEREGVPHHLVDVVDPDQTFSAARFSRLSEEILEAMWKESGAVIFAGGTGFYLRALLWGLFPGPAAHPEIRERLFAEASGDGLDKLYERLRGIDPEAARRIHPNDSVRIVRALEVYEVTGEPVSSHYRRQNSDGPRYEALIIGLAMDRELMYERINRRAGVMMERGLVEEVARLREMGYGADLPSQQALGYRQAHLLIAGEIDRGQAIDQIQRDTRHYARRQLTWLRKEPGLEWMDVDEKDKIIARIVSCLERDQ